MFMLTFTAESPGLVSIKVIGRGAPGLPVHASRGARVVSDPLVHKRELAWSSVAVSTPGGLLAGLSTICFGAEKQMGSAF